jgi:hypothetical protein
VAHQPAELGGAFTESRITKRLLDHSASEPGGWIGGSLQLLYYSQSSK